jgi:hypothetical protein
MKGSRLTLIVFCLTAVLACAQTARAAQAGEGVIFGTFTFKGCTPTIQSIAVAAVRADFAAATLIAGGTPAAIAATSDPQSFDFRIDGLQAGQLYIVEAGVTPGVCGKLILQAADFGLTVAGSNAPVRLTGYAILSRFDVRASSGRRAESWMPAESVDLGDPSGATRRIRFSTDLPHAVGFELQLSTNPFPKNPRQISNSCDEPASGIFYRQSVPFGSREGERTAGEAIEAVVDFYQLVNTGSISDGTSQLSDIDRVMLNRGAPIHIRAVPFTPDGPACDTSQVGLNPEVLIAAQKKKILDAALNVFSPLRVVPFVYERPTFDFSQGSKPCAVVIHARTVVANALFADVWDSAYFQKYQKVNAEPGERFCISASKSSDSSLLEQATSIVTGVFSGVFDGISWVVNNAAKLYDEAKALAVKVAAEALTETMLVDCNNSDLCKAAIEAALTYAMASMGVPPSLPNFDQLMNEGVDYVAARAASEAGIPPELSEEVADRAYDLAKKEIEKASAKRSIEGFPSWIVPDIGWEYGRVIVSLVKTGLGAAMPERFVLQGNHLFLGTEFDVPRRWPGKQPSDPDLTQLSVPLTLAPDVTTIGLPLWAKMDSNPLTIPLYYKEQWDIRFYGTGCEHWVGVLAARFPNNLVANYVLLDGRMFTEQDGFLFDPYFSYCKTYID